MTTGGWVLALVLLGTLSALSLFWVTHVRTRPIAEAAACVTAPSGLVSWWPGDGTAEDIVGGNNGVLLSGATFGSGMVGQALSFDGLDDRFTASSTGLPTGSADRTIEFWVNSPNTAVADIFLVGWGNPATGQMSAVTLGLNNQPSRKFAFWGHGTNFQSVSTLADNTWYHLAITLEGTSVTLYLNGILDDSATLSGLSTPSSTTFFIGDFTSTMTNFNGLIDEVGVYDRAISASEIQAIDAAGSAGKCKPGATPIPSLSQWALIGMALLLGGLFYFVLARRSLRDAA